MPVTDIAFIVFLARRAIASISPILASVLLVVQLGNWERADFGDAAARSAESFEGVIRCRLSFPDNYFFEFVNFPALQLALSATSSRQLENRQAAKSGHVVVYSLPSGQPVKSGEEWWGEDLFCFSSVSFSY
mmetsp:Transcript_3013/g.6594  ORF Transcript_3013/g.6594 Transcript_3013/m.6594 type:complete len:132 (-) Transcript_3013:360-755(-)